MSAKLAPVSYPAPKQLQTVVVATSSALDIAIATPNIWSVQGASIDVPVNVRVLSNGTPVAGLSVNYSISLGSATFSPSAIVTDTNGYASATLHIPALNSQITGTACVASGSTSRCQSMNVLPLTSSLLKIQSLGGNQQQVAVGQTFRPITVRVVDSSSPPNTVFGVPVVFESLLGGALNNAPSVWIGNSQITQNPMPMVLASATATVTSDLKGVTTFQPSAQGITGPVLILGIASFGAATQPCSLQSLP